MSYDTWLQDSAAYEHFAGLDGLTEEESDAKERELERRTEERIERDAESDGGRPGAD